jgi:hypothetical protein
MSGAEPLYNVANAVAGDPYKTFSGDGWPILAVGDLVSDAWGFYFNLTPWIRHGATIKKIRLRVERAIDVNEYYGDIEIRVAKATTSLGFITSSFVNIGSSTVSLPYLGVFPATQPISILEFDINSAHVLSLDSLSVDYIRVYIKQVTGVGTGGMSIAIHGIDLEMEINSIDQGISVTS